MDETILSQISLLLDHFFKVLFRFPFPSHLLNVIFTNFYLAVFFSKFIDNSRGWCFPLASVVYLSSRFQLGIFSPNSVLRNYWLFKSWKTELSFLTIRPVDGKLLTPRESLGFSAWLENTCSLSSIILLRVRSLSKNEALRFLAQSPACCKLLSFYH